MFACACVRAGGRRMRHISLLEGRHRRAPPPHSALRCSNRRLPDANKCPPATAGSVATTTAPAQTHIASRRHVCHFCNNLCELSLCLPTTPSQHPTPICYACPATLAQPSKTHCEGARALKHTILTQISDSYTEERR